MSHAMSGISSALRAPACRVDEMPAASLNTKSQWAVAGRTSAPVVTGFKKPPQISRLRFSVSVEMPRASAAALVGSQSSVFMPRPQLAEPTGTNGMTSPVWLSIICPSSLSQPDCTACCCTAFHQHLGARHSHHAFSEAHRGSASNACPAHCIAQRRFTIPTDPKGLKLLDQWSGSRGTGESDGGSGVQFHPGRPASPNSRFQKSVGTAGVLVNPPF